MSAILSIEQQIAAMAEAWPMLMLEARDDRSARWRGPLKPLFQTFIVEITYRAPLAIEMLSKRQLQPRVQILSPRLRPRPGDPEGRLPHVYYVTDDDVILCMFDPESDEWSPTLALAASTVPWTIDWITSYEGWRATGEWTGGGKHLTQPMLAEG